MTSEPPPHPRPAPAPSPRGQRAFPRGALGVLTGHLMAAQGARRRRWLRSLLELQPNFAVLDVGAGPGTDIRTVSAVVTRGLVAGVDPSPLMVRQARRRNAVGIASGRVRVELAWAEALPYADRSFDRIYAIDSLPFWRDVPAGVRECVRVLRRGGRLVVALPLSRDGRPGQGGTTAVEVMFRQEGLVGVATTIQSASAAPAVCVVGERPR